MSRFSTIKLPVERIDQLKALGAAWNLPTVEVITRLIHGEIERGTIKDGIPGVVVKKIGASVRLAVDEGEPINLSKDAARSLADALESAVNGSGTVSLKHNYSVTRKGGGIRLLVPFPKGEVRMLTRDIARDLARLIAKAAQ